MNDPDLVKRLAASGADFKNIPARQASPIENFFLNWILPILILWGIGSYVSGKMMNRMGGNAMTFGKANAKVYVKSKDGGITFADVAGEDEAKESLSEIVNYLHDPKKYQEIGASMPKGILLVGPPGTGKTMLAKAVAGESHVPFFAMSGLGICGDVRRSRRFQSARFIQAGKGKSALHCVYRRNRCHR